MTSETKINMDAFKTVTKAIAFSWDLEQMASHLALLLTGALEIKACAIWLWIRRPAIWDDWPATA